MKRNILITSSIALVVLAAHAQTSRFLPGHLAVVRAGDGELELKLKQSPIFIDQFDPAGLNHGPTFTVNIPCKGTEPFFFNGHAATEGTLSRSPDHKLLALAGYGGVSLLQSNGTPSLLDIQRAFCTVDAAAKIHISIYKTHSGEGKMNPRGVVTDGANNFWGCGSALGNVYYNPTASAQSVEFSKVLSSRSAKIINNALYVTLNSADGNASDLPAGIFSFDDGHGNRAPLPRSADSSLRLVLAASAPYTKIAGFDMNSSGTIAYTADTVAGIQKYVKNGDSWKFACNFSIPQNIPAAENHATGCFGLAVDFAGPAPVIYATTTEGYGGCVNSNRVVRIADTNATATVTTLAQAPSARIAYRGIDFTPELGPAKP